MSLSCLGGKHITAWLHGSFSTLNNYDNLQQLYDHQHKTVIEQLLLAPALTMPDIKKHPLENL